MGRPIPLNNYPLTTRERPLSLTWEEQRTEPSISAEAIHPEKKHPVPFLWSPPLDRGGHVHQPLAEIQRSRGVEHKEADTPIAEQDVQLHAGMARLSVQGRPKYAREVALAGDLKVAMDRTAGARLTSSHRRLRGR
jgi:hypothetical protein